MQIKNFRKISLIDYPGKITATVFTCGCNFSCGFCHNPDLVIIKNNIIKNNNFFKFLKSRQGLIDSICITGGEPTLQPDLIDFIQKIKKLNFLVKLDTNGSNYKIIKNLLKNNLLDYIAMDIKCSLENYYKVYNKKNNIINNIKKNINLIKNSNINYEFRTTIVPDIINKAEIKKIINLLKNSKAYYLQQFRNNKTLDKKYQKIQPYSDKELKDLANLARPYFDNVGVRGL